VKETFGLLSINCDDDFKFDDYDASYLVFKVDGGADEIRYKTIDFLKNLKFTAIGSREDNMRRDLKKLMEQLRLVPSGIDSGYSFGYGGNQTVEFNFIVVEDTL